MKHLVWSKKKFLKCLSVDTYAFTILVHFDCHADVDNVQRRELVQFYRVYAI